MVLKTVFFFFWIKFQPMTSVFGDCVFYHQTKTTIGFWCRRELNSRSLIQPSETLLVELIGTHKIIKLWTNNLYSLLPRLYGNPKPPYCK